MGEHYRLPWYKLPILIVLRGLKCRLIHRGHYWRELGENAAAISPITGEPIVVKFTLICRRCRVVEWYW